jgi:aminoglycoside phosphotransferase (APT) family kinase protein
MSIRPYGARLIEHEVKVFERLAQAIAPGSKLLRTWPLAGGVSAQVTAFQLRNMDGAVERFVVRRHGARDLARDPEIAATEFRLLQVLHEAGVRAPGPHYVDACGEIFGTPCIVLVYVDGTRDEPPAGDERLVGELSNALAEIHRVDLTDLAFLRRLEPADIAAVNSPVLLHGDFWPGNALWRDGRLVAIVDWDDAAIGDPLADVANARLELLWARGHDAMNAFTQRYAALTGVDLAHLPHWDLWADRRLTPRISQWGLDEAVQNDMRAKRETFVAQARAAS